MFRQRLSSARAVGAVVAAAIGAGLLAAPATAVAQPQEQRPASAARQDDAREEAVQKAMDDLVRAGVPGVLAQLGEGGRTWHADAGVADVTNGREREKGDHFRIGSITKTFVSTVILQLEAEGELDLDDTVEKWLPGLVTGNGHDGSKVTVRQLLNHTSGVNSFTDHKEFAAKYLTEGFLQNRFHRHSPESLVGWAMSEAPDFAPGTGFHYSNTNYILAGMIVEKVTGDSYERAVRDRILRPLGLENTLSPRHRTGLPQPSGRGYVRDGAGPHIDVTRMNASWGWAAGDMISTTSDLRRFLRTLITGGLLPEAQQKELTTVVADGEQAYALGLERPETSCGVQLWGHTGGIHGSSSAAFTTKDGKRTLVMNLNGMPDKEISLEPLLNAAFCPR